MSRAEAQRRGSAVVALLIVAVIILGSMLMLDTAAVIDVQRLERAIELSRENGATSRRVVQAAREAAQRTFGPNGEKTDTAFRTEFSGLISALEDQSVVTFDAATFDAAFKAPAEYPDWSGGVASLSAPSAELLAVAGPQLRFMIGSRVAESAKSTLALNYSRLATGPEAQHYAVAAEVRLVSVPLTRFALCGYDLPDEIGSGSGSSLEWPTYFSVSQIAPVGLAPARDPANINDLTSGQTRPAHFRYLAALSEEYQHVFSQAYLQRLVDFAGSTHYLKIGNNKTNPVWSGAKESAKGLALDVGEFGDGTAGSVVAQKSCGVICSAQGDTQIVISDDGSRTSAIILVVVGPSDLALSPTHLVFTTAITRPFVLIGYHVVLEASSPITLNGAVFLDRDSVVNSVAGPFTVGHLSYWLGNAGKIAVNAFRPGALPEEIEGFVPRVVYAVVNEKALSYD